MACSEISCSQRFWYVCVPCQKLLGRNSHQYHFTQSQAHRDCLASVEAKLANSSSNDSFDRLIFKDLAEPQVSTAAQPIKSDCTVSDSLLKMRSSKSLEAPPKKRNRCELDNKGQGEDCTFEDEEERVVCSYPQSKDLCDLWLSDLISSAPEASQEDVSSTLQDVETIQLYCSAELATPKVDLEEALFT